MDFCPRSRQEGSQAPPPAPCLQLCFLWILVWLGEAAVSPSPFLTFPILPNAHPSDPPGNHPPLSHEPCRLCALAAPRGCAWDRVMGASLDEGRGAWWAVGGVTDVKSGNPDYISPNHLFPECSRTELHPWGPDIYQMDRETGWTRAFRVQPGWSCWLLLWLLKLEDLVFRFLLFCPISSFFGLRSRLHGPQRPFQV